MHNLTSDASHALFLRLEYESGQSIVWSSSDVASTLAAGTYYARVSALASGPFGYRLRYAQFRDGGAGGKTRATAKNLGELTETPQNLRGSTKINLSPVYYRFTLSGAGTIRVSGYAERGRTQRITDVDLQNSSGQHLDSFRTGEDLRLSAGTYYLGVSDGSSKYGYGYSYIITLITTDAAASARLTSPPASLSATSQPFWHDDAVTAATAPRPNQKRQLQGAGGMLSA